jgi:hypothetical protein
MRRMVRFTLAALMVCGVCALSRSLLAEEKEDVDNPRYKGWVNFKPGSKAVVKEHTVLADGTVDEREIEYQLLKTSPKRVTVHTSVIQRDLLSRIKTAPTEITYPAKVSKAELKAALADTDGVKRGKDTLKVDGKDLECATTEVVHKSKDEEVKSKTWRSADIPGGIVKRVRTTTQDGKLVATTTTTLLSYRVGPYVKGKEKEKKE